MERNSTQRTALCPYCGIDSVIGSASGVEISSKLLKEMHDYYIALAKSLAEEGKYEEALKNLSYLNPYYNEEEISKLEDEYNKSISNYTMTSNDIKNLICRRSNEKKEDLGSGNQDFTYSSATHTVRSLFHRRAGKGARAKLGDGVSAVLGDSNAGSSGKKTANI